MTAAARPMTIVAPIADGRRDELAGKLAQIRDGITTNAVLRPAEMPDTHFTRWLILGDPHPEPHPYLLVWETNHDGDPVDYLAEVVAAVPAGIDALFGCCDRYPGDAAGNSMAVVDWLRARMVRAQAVYRAYQRLTHKAIENDVKVRIALGDILDTDRGALIALAPAEIHHRVRATLHANHPELDTTNDGDGTLTIWLKRIAVILLSAPFVIALIPVWIGILCAVRRAERRDAATVKPVDRPVHDDADLHQFEDRVMQNQLTHVVDLKGGTLRLATVWIVLTVIDVLARVFYVNGALQHMTTIHMARWAILYDERPDPAVRRHRLMFFSNYDGSWDAYLGEFIDRGSPGLTAIWSNTEGFPETKWLLGAGSRDEESFKQWARARQRPAAAGEAQAWWSGIPSLTVANVRDNAWVRRRVDRRLDDEEARAWLRRI